MAKVVLDVVVALLTVDGALGVDVDVVCAGAKIDVGLAAEYPDDNVANASSSNVDMFFLSSTANDASAVGGLVDGAPAGDAEASVSP